MSVTFSSVEKMQMRAKLTPANERSQTPSQRVQPDHDDGHGGPSLGAPAHGLQRLGDDHVAIDGDGQEVYHGGDAEQGAAERVQLTACKQKHVSITSLLIRKCSLVARRR